jgi:hypothetical protein
MFIMYCHEHNSVWAHSLSFVTLGDADLHASYSFSSHLSWFNILSTKFLVLRHRHRAEKCQNLKKIVKKVKNGAQDMHFFWVQLQAELAEMRPTAVFARCQWTLCCSHLSGSFKYEFWSLLEDVIYYLKGNKSHHKFGSTILQLYWFSR